MKSLKSPAFSIDHAVFLHSDHAQPNHWTMCFWLFYFQPLHKPPILLRRQAPYFILTPGPLVCPTFQTLIQENETILFPVQTLDPVSPPPAKQKQRIGERIQLELLLHHAGQTIYSFSQICVPTGDIHFICSGEVAQQVRSNSTRVRSNSGFIS